MRSFTVLKKKIGTLTSFFLILSLLPSLSVAYAQAVVGTYGTTMSGKNQVPPNGSPGTGQETLTLYSDNSAKVSLSFQGMLGPELNTHIHGPASTSDVNAIVFVLPNGVSVSNFVVNFNATQLGWLNSGLLYADVHSTIYPDGEIRGQLSKSGGVPTTAPTTIPTNVPQPTAIPTNMPYPTALPTTPPINGTTFTISVCLHGFGNCGDNSAPNKIGTINPLHPQRTVIISVLNGSYQTVMTQQGSLTYNANTGTFNGTIPMNNLPSGTYLIKEKVNGFLTSEIKGIVSISSGVHSVLPTTSAVTGDVNNDNKLDILDYNMLLDCYSDLTPAKNCTDPNKKQMTDVNDDGKVDQFDINYFIREMSVQPGA